MKFYLILFICIAAAAAEPLRPLDHCIGRFLRQAVKKCSKEVGVTQADIEDYVYLRWAANDKAKCFRACLFNECNAFNPDGTVVPNAVPTVGFMTSSRDPSIWPIAEEAARRCMEILPPVASNRCETTETFMRCFTAKSPVQLSVVGAYCDQYEGGDDVICK